MSSSEAASYVRRQLADGHSKEEVTESLKASGWQQDDITKLFEEMDKPEKEAAPAAPTTEKATPASGETPTFTTPNGPFPPELRGWNWGAFLLNWIWGIGNNVWIGLLCFVPVIGWVMPFVLGAKGNEWAWKNRHFDSVEQFKAVQKAWTTWGVVLLVFNLLIVFMIIRFIFGVMNWASLQTNTHAIDDANRKSDVTDISYALDDYRADSRNNGQYPASLQKLVPTYMDAIPTDPATSQAYEYTTSGTTYKVCATLSTDEKYCANSEQAATPEETTTPVKSPGTIQFQ